MSAASSGPTKTKPTNVTALQAGCKLWVSGSEGRFYGPGVHQLLCLMRHHHSLRHACAAMGLSYSKGRRMMREMEGQLGFAVLRRQRGGAGGGHSSLTPDAEAWMRCYEAFSTQSGQLVQQAFALHFAEFSPAAHRKEQP